MFGTLFYLFHTGSLSFFVLFYWEYEKWEKSHLQGIDAIHKFRNYKCTVITVSVT